MRRWIGPLFSAVMRRGEHQSGSGIDQHGADRHFTDRCSGFSFGQGEIHVTRAGHAMDQT